MKKLLCLLLVAVFCTVGFGCNKKDPLDLDLSEMSEVSAYSQICLVGEYPDGFFGHTIRVRGRLFNNEAGDKYFCAVPDGTGHRYAYLELSFAEGQTLPELGDEMLIQGVFDSNYTDFVKDVYCGRLLEVVIEESHEFHDTYDHSGHDHSGHDH